MYKNNVLIKIIIEKSVIDFLDPQLCLVDWGLVLSFGIGVIILGSEKIGNISVALFHLFDYASARRSLRSYRVLPKESRNISPKTE